MTTMNSKLMHEEDMLPISCGSRPSFWETQWSLKPGHCVRIIVVI